jgi:hypothetical protein
VEQLFYFNPTKMMPYNDVFLQGALYDRNQIVSPTEHIKLLTPLGQLTQPNNIYDICLDRANELAKLVEGTDKKVHVFWSGGLDSTAVLMSIREVVPANKIVVLYAPESLVEYPGFFEQHINGIFETFEFSMGTVWKAVDFACANGIAVTGEIGDQLFGHILYLDRDPSWLMQPWEDLNAGITSNEEYHRLAAACPQKVTNIAEFLWWVNYSMKYQLVQCRMLLNNSSSVLNQNFFHFFDSKEFNDYTVSTPIEEKIPGHDMKNYKKPLRDVIYKLSNDAAYAYTKPKVRSLVPVYGRYTRNKIAFAIDTNWKRYYAA